MAMSGVTVDADIATFYNDMKLRKTHKYATFKIENKKRIIIDQKGDPVATDTRDDDKVEFDKMKTSVTVGSKEPRYILYDFNFQMKEGRTLQKLAFIFWCPDDGKIGDKMVYASSKDSIKKVFTGIGAEFQANDLADFDYTTFADEVEKKA